MVNKPIVYLYINYKSLYEVLSFEYTERPRCSVIICSQKYNGTSNMTEFWSSSSTPLQAVLEQKIYVTHLYVYVENIQKGLDPI